MSLRYDSSREKVCSNHGRPVWPSFGPKKEELKAQEPAVEAPKAEELATEAPKAEEPAAETPKAEELAAEAPKADEPAAEAAAPKVEETAAEVQEVPRALGSRLRRGQRWGRPKQVQEPVARTSPGGGRGRRWSRKIQNESPPSRPTRLQIGRAS